MPEYPIEKVDKVMYHVGLGGILIAAFCWGFNMIHFKLNVKVD